MASSADPLRRTLDNLELDPSSAADRPYLVAMLRRLGYTERDIEEVVRTGRMPANPPASPPAPVREYRLVVPARDSRFALENASGGAGSDAPFEDLERVEFEDPAQDVEFLPESEEEAAARREREGLQWEETQEQPTPLAEEPAEAAPDQRAGEAGFDESAIDTFGSPDAAAGATRRTRVRVRRIRAGSKEEAERKVAGAGRNVIKSVPVDIVERWGAAQKPAQPKDDEKGGQA